MSDIITVHAESDDNTIDVLKKIKALGKKAGISIKPNTPEETLEPFLEHCDLVLVMTVEPGFGGQKFMANQLKKIQNIRSMISNMSRKIYLEVDGGINPETSILAVNSGANVLVAGNYIFSEGVNYYKNKILHLKNLT